MYLPYRASVAKCTPYSLLTCLCLTTKSAMSTYLVHLCMPIYAYNYVVSYAYA